MYLDSTIIDFFDTCSLKELEDLQLLKRKDTKFLLPFNLLDSLLIRLQKDYKILENKGIRVFNYHSIYYDSFEKIMFLQHHNQKMNRYKIRKRIYTDFNLSWGEIKQKTKNNKTIKKRILLDNSIDFNTFINNTSSFSSIDLKEVLQNKFKRISLISKKETEKITIDFDIKSFSLKKEVTWPFLAIVEVKNNNKNQSLIFDLMKQYGIRTHSFSKYATAMVSLNSELKYNNLKETLLLLNKIKKTNDY